MAKHHVYSTLTQHQHYTNWTTPVEGGLPQVTGKVSIKGGANLADKTLVTPHGVLTTIDDEQLEVLENNFLFKQHVKSGHIVVRKDKVDPEVAVAADMEKRDGSAPVTPESLEELTGRDAIAAKPMDDNAFKKAKGR